MRGHQQTPVAAPSGVVRARYLRAAEDLSRPTIDLAHFSRAIEIQVDVRAVGRNFDSVGKGSVGSGRDVESLTGLPRVNVSGIETERRLEDSPDRVVPRHHVGHQEAAGG